MTRSDLTEIVDATEKIVTISLAFADKDVTAGAVRDVIAASFYGAAGNRTMVGVPDARMYLESVLRRCIAILNPDTTELAA